MATIHPIVFRFQRKNESSYLITLSGAHIGEMSGYFIPPYDSATWQALWKALDPGFQLANADSETQALLQPFGDLSDLHRRIGTTLADALLAGHELRQGFDTSLTLSENERETLPVEMRFGVGCDDLAAFSWELLFYRSRFLVADTSIAISRYPEGPLPALSPLTELPLRVLVVLSEPPDAGRTLPQQARAELLHGLRKLDEEGAVIVDELRPPTYETLVEAVTTGDYHLLVFYGHGIHNEYGGHLLFEDEYGGQNLVSAEILGRALRNTGIQLVVLGACQSASVISGDMPATNKEFPDTAPAIWQGTAQALVRTGIPMVVGMQVSMLVVAAQAFLRQFALSLAIGKPVIEAVADGRRPLNQDRYKYAWFIPTLYGRPRGDTRIFDPAVPLPENTAELREQTKDFRAEIEQLEQDIGSLGVLSQVGEIAKLRTSRTGLVRVRAELARRTPGGYTSVTSILYGVHSNPVFIGRAKELMEVSRELVQEHPVVVWGVGGIGKTALAVEIAQRQGWRYPAGVLWLDCKGGPALDTLLDTIGAFCGQEFSRVPPEEKESAARLALARLDKEALLIWDSAEDVWSYRPVRQFVRNLPSNCQLLMTTRRDPNEAMWSTIELQSLLDSAMTDLFYRLASNSQVKVGNQADLDVIPHIIDWLQGHPLALNLLVPLAKRRGLQRVWRELQKNPLKGVAAAFAVSFERLTASQQRLFTRLSVFTIPFVWEAVEALLPDEEYVDEMLDVLVQRALITFDGARYTYHALLRQYAYQKLQELEDPNPVHKLAAAYLESKLQNEGGIPEERLQIADQWEQAEEWEQFVMSAGKLVGSLDSLGYWEEIRERLERARKVVNLHLESSPGIEAKILSAIATITYKSAQWDESLNLLEEVVEIYEQADDSRGVAETWNSLGMVHESKGEWNRAIELFEKALAILEELGDSHRKALVYHGLGNVYYRKGDWDTAEGFYHQSHSIYKQVNDDTGVAETCGGLGNVYLSKGEWDKAIEFYQKALTIDEQIGDIHSIAKTQNGLASVYYRKGDLDTAEKLYRKALATKEQIGDIYGMAGTYNNLGSVYASKREWDVAKEFYQTALAIYEQIDVERGMATTYAGLANVYSNKGKWSQAEKFYRKALTIYEQFEDGYGIAQTLGNLAVFYEKQGNMEEAAHHAALTYLIFTKLDAPETQQAVSHLVKILGSVELADAYLARIVKES